MTTREGADLERMVKDYGIPSILNSLADVCRDKSIRLTNLTDFVLAQCWSDAEELLIVAARTTALVNLPPWGRTP